MISGNPLATHRGRLAAFFLLYVAEGIPFGFTSTAVVAYLSRSGLSAAQVAAFGGLLYLPWSWKFLAGPLVDVLYSQRLGRRRGWILGTQLLMCVGFVGIMPIDAAGRLLLFTAMLFFINLLGATQDVAIDALACGVLDQAERGMANGLMFAGFYVGQAVGGSGMLMLAEHVPFQLTFLCVAGCVALIAWVVTSPLHEPPVPSAVRAPVWADLGTRMIRYLADTLRTLFGTRASRAGLVFAALPAGAYALSLALATHLSVELGMSNEQISLLTLICAVVAAISCVAGGYLSDRLGRRRMLALFVFMTIVPTLYLAGQMQRSGWILPRSSAGVAPAGLIRAFWSASLVYSVFQGLYYGTRTALYMDLCNPAVAATQFTAYMAMMNVAISYTSVWQGWAVQRWGYPCTLLLDSIVGVVGLAALPWMRARSGANGRETPGAFPVMESSRAS